MWIAQQLRLQGVWEVERRLTYSELLDWQDYYRGTGGLSYAERVNYARIVWSLALQNWDPKKKAPPEVEEFLYPPSPDIAPPAPEVKRRDVALVKSLKAQAAKMKKHAEHQRRIEAEKSNG